MIGGKTGEVPKLALLGSIALSYVLYSYNYSNTYLIVMYYIHTHTHTIYSA
jgi:hypothetical protein